MSQSSSPFPHPSIKSQLTQRVAAMSSIRGAESGDRAKDQASSLNKRPNREIPCLPTVFIKLPFVLAWYAEFTFTFATGESINKNTF